MALSLTPHEALIYVMVTTSAVDRNMTDLEFARMGAIASQLPVFAGFDENRLVPISEECGAALAGDDGLDDVLTAVAEALPKKLYETAYALAVDIAAVDLDVTQEELRFLSLLRDALGLEKLVVAAIERGARARHQILNVGA